jgi:hypothetical protein
MIKSMEEVLSMKARGTVSIYQCFTRVTFRFGKWQVFTLGDYPVKLNYLDGLKYIFAVKRSWAGDEGTGC